MTDTGQVPGEGQPGYADAQPEQPQQYPTAAAQGGYTYADPDAHEAHDVHNGHDVHADVPGEDEDLLMPGMQSAWSDGQTSSGQYDVQHPAQPAQQPSQGGTPSTPGHQAAAVQQGAPRRPLHLGPPVPEQSGAVRTLADRGPSTPPAAQPPAQPSDSVQSNDGQAAPEPEPAQPSEPAPGPAPAPEAPSGPEYLDVPAQGPEAWTAVPQGPDTQPGPEAVAGAPPEAAQTPAEPLPGPDLAAVPETAGSAPSQAPEPRTVPEAEPEPLPEPGQAAQPHPEVLPQPQPEAVERGPLREAVPGPAHDTAPASPETSAPTEQPAPHPEQTTEPAESAGTAGAAPEQDAAPEAQELSDAPGTEPAAEGPVHDPQQGPEAPAPVDEATPEAAAVAEQEIAPGAAGEDAAHPVALEQDTPTVPGPRTHEPDVPETVAGRRPSEPQDAPAAEPAEPAEPVAPGPDADASHDAAPPISEDGPAEDAAPSDDGVPAEEPLAAEVPRTEEPPTEHVRAEDVQAGHVQPEDVQPEDAQPEEPAGPAAAAEAADPDDAEAVGGPGTAAPGYSDADREAVHRLMRERRDIRNGFRPDPIPHEVLLRVLEAAHTAPSVGHSQPWDFVVIRSEETRRTMHELARQQREVYAKSLPKARAKQFKQLKIEAILDTPVNIVVTADPTRGGRHTLGRHTQPQMAPYSSALAVENLWLAARAEGLGVGWVSFFDEREMVRALDLPEHLDVVAYLCIGYVDEFPPEPELMQAGWSKRRPLSWVVHEESYGRRALPGAEPHDLLAETLEGIRPLDAKALGEAWERQKRMTKPAGALGMLEIISAQLCGLSRQCPPPVPEPAAVAVFAGDHGVHAQGVTPWPQEVTAQMVANFLGGGAVCNAFANQVGAEVCVIDVGVSSDLPATPGLLPRKVRPGTADMTQGAALTQEEVLRAIEVGIETARDLVAAGNKTLVTGEMGIANTTASAALIAACTGADPAEVTGRGTGIDDETHVRKVDVVRRALQLHQPDPGDPVGMLSAVGGLEHAALTGFILGGASLRTPVILDGVSAGAAALVARQIAPEALAACIAGHRSAEPGHVAALTKLGLRPLIDLDLRLGEGTGALLALPMVQSAARAMHEVATFDSAGVTEKN